ncbi:MAG: hypothetical protein HY724_07300 [Candidatus Rokubacteria bacterium]|nr:hypothetical protein [Candidatus Rokubacteria bacterium]
MAESEQVAATGHEAFEENQRLALVCHDAAEPQAAIKTALQELGFKVHTAGSPSDAIERMRKTSYEVVILDEEFQGATPHDNPVLQALQSMPMVMRRYIFVALVGKQFKTLDNMMAFAKSANVVVNANDLPKINGVLRQGMSDNEAFYRVLREVLREAGKR